MRDSDDEDKEVEEKPSKKKSKQRQKPELKNGNSCPGKYVLLKPQTEEKKEIDDAENSVITTVRSVKRNLRKFLTKVFPDVESNRRFVRRDNKSHR